MNCIEPIMPWALGATYPRWTEKLSDGTCISIRPVREEDQERERKFIEALSPGSRRYRFLGQIREPSPELLKQLTTLDYRHDVAFAASISDDPNAEFIGVGRYGTNEDGTRCEFAVAVLDRWQHHGLGTVLTRHLMQVARARGINYMYSLDAADNAAMAELAKSLGFQRRVDPEDPAMVIHSLWLPAQGP